MEKRRGIITFWGRWGRMAGFCVSIAALFALSGCAATALVIVSGYSVKKHIDADEQASAGYPRGGTGGEVDSAWAARELAFEEADRYHLAQDHFIIARDYERRGELGMAEHFYRTAFDFWPKSTYMRKMLTDRYLLVNAYDKALELFFKDGETTEDLTAEEKRTLSFIYLRLGQVANSTEVLETLGSEMSDEEAYSLAVLYRASGETDKAMTAFRKFYGRGGERFTSGIRLVQASIAERKFADAESLAVILREAYPKNAEIASLLGTVKYLNSDTATAVKHFFEALALDSLNEEALRTLAHIHIVREEYPEAVSYYKRLTAQKKIGDPYRRGMAILLYYIKEYDEAGAHLDTLIQERNTQDLPGLHELHLYRGLVHSQTKAYDKAAGEFRAAIAIDSMYEDAWKELCFVNIVSKDKENARASADRYVTLFPNSGAAWRFSGYAFEMQKKYDDAAIAFEKAIRIDPNDYFAWFRLGSALERQKLIDKAADAFRKVLQLRPGYADAANYLGYMWADAGIMLDSAKILIEIALEKEPENGAYIDSYAWVFYKLGDYEKALHYMNEAMKYIKDDPYMKDDPVPYEHIGDIQFQLKNYREAEAAYKRSIELKTEDAERIKKRLAEIREILRKGGGR